MSGLEVVIYIAGILALAKIFLKEIIRVIRLARKAAHLSREPLLSAQHSVELAEARSKHVAGLRNRNSAE